MTVLAIDELNEKLEAKCLPHAQELINAIVKDFTESNSLLYYGVDGDLILFDDYGGVEYSKPVVACAEKLLQEKIPGVRLTLGFYPHYRILGLFTVKRWGVYVTLS